MKIRTNSLVVALALTGLAASGCMKRKYNSDVLGTSNKNPKCEIPVAVGPNVFDQNAELGDFPDKENIVKTPDLPQSFRAELINQFFHSLYWSTTVLHQQGGFQNDAATLTPSDGGATSLTLTGNTEPAKAPVVLERIIVTKDASTEIEGSVKLITSSQKSFSRTSSEGTSSSKSNVNSDNAFSFNYVREPYFVFYKLVTNPNVPFNCNGKETRFPASKVFPGNVKAKVEVNRNISLSINITVGIDTALEMTGVPPAIADVLVKFLNVKGSVDGKFVVRDPIAHEMTYRGRTSNGLSKFEHGVAKNVVQPLCAFVLAEIGESGFKQECEAFLPGIPDPATDLQDMVNPKRKNLVYPVTSCSVAGRSGLFNLYALSIRVPSDYEPNAEQVAKNQIRFNVFKREQANANSSVAAWTNQNAWVTLKAVGGDTSCLEGLKDGQTSHKCAVVELGQNVFGAALHPKFECLCARIGDGTDRKVSDRCQNKDRNLRAGANYAVSESKDRVAYPQPEPQTREAPAPLVGGQAPEIAKDDANKLPETSPLP